MRKNAIIDHIKDPFLKLKKISKIKVFSIRIFYSISVANIIQYASLIFIKRSHFQHQKSHATRKQVWLATTGNHYVNSHSKNEKAKLNPRMWIAKVVHILIRYGNDAPITIFSVFKQQGMHIFFHENIESWHALVRCYILTYNCKIQYEISGSDVTNENK